MIRTALPIALAGLLVTACSEPTTPATNTAPTTTATSADTRAEGGEPYSRFTVAKQNRILARQAAGEMLTEEEEAFIRDNPPIDEEE